jgi:hypothetical protein
MGLSQAECLSQGLKRALVDFMNVRTIFPAALVPKGMKRESSRLVPLTAFSCVGGRCVPPADIVRQIPSYQAHRRPRHSSSPGLPLHRPRPHDGQPQTDRPRSYVRRHVSVCASHPIRPINRTNLFPRRAHMFDAPCPTHHRPTHGQARRAHTRPVRRTVVERAYKADGLTTSCQVRLQPFVFFVFFFPLMSDGRDRSDTQNGPASGRTVPHVHFHILPRRP